MNCPRCNSKLGVDRTKISDNTIIRYRSCSNNHHFTTIERFVINDEDVKIDEVIVKIKDILKYLERY